MTPGGSIDENPRGGIDANRNYISDDWINIPSEADYTMCLQELIEDESEAKCDINLFHAIAEDECLHHWSTKRERRKSYAE